jgi:hypothetical protein
LIGTKFERSRWNGISFPNLLGYENVSNSKIVLSFNIFGCSCNIISEPEKLRTEYSSKNLQDRSAGVADEGICYG